MASTGKKEEIAATAADAGALGPNVHTVEEASVEEGVLKTWATKFTGSANARVGLANVLLVLANSLGASPSAIVPSAALYNGDDEPYDSVDPLSLLVPGTAVAVAEDGSGDGASDTRYDAST